MLQKCKHPKMGCPENGTKLQLWGFNSRDPGGVEYPFIAITSQSTLTQKGSFFLFFNSISTFVGYLMSNPPL